jgi:hypothetical protein
VLATQEINVGTRAYKLTQLRAGPARRLLIRLFRSVGPAISMLVGKDGGLAGLKADDLAGAVRLLAADLTEDEFESIITELLFTGHVEQRQDNGGWTRLDKDIADLTFAGRLDELFGLVSAALKFNYSSFLGGLETMAGNVGLVRQPVKAP